MVKTISLNEYVYSKLVSFAGEMTAGSSRPVSLGMAISLALMVTELAFKRMPQWEKDIEEVLKKAKNPKEFDEHWEKTYREITQESK